jgi:hypothetical protein
MERVELSDASPSEMSERLIRTWSIWEDVSSVSSRDSCGGTSSLCTSWIRGLSEAEGRVLVDAFECSVVGRTGAGKGGDGPVGVVGSLVGEVGVVGIAGEVACSREGDVGVDLVKLLVNLEKCFCSPSRFAAVAT